MARHASLGSMRGRGCFGGGDRGWRGCLGVVFFSIFSVCVKPSPQTNFLFNTTGHDSDSDSVSNSPLISYTFSFLLFLSVKVLGKRVGTVSFTSGSVLEGAGSHTSGSGVKGAWESLDSGLRVPRVPLSRRLMLTSRDWLMGAGARED